MPANIGYLTHLSLDTIFAISQMIFSKAFSWIKCFIFWLKFHWSLFLRLQLTITQHWFKYLVPNRWQAIIWTNADPIYRCIYVALGGDELRSFMIQECMLTDESCVTWKNNSTSIYHNSTHSFIPVNMTWQVCRLALGPFSLKICKLIQPKFNKNLFCSNFDINCPFQQEFCTYHNSSAVVACRKNGPNKPLFFN